MTTAIISALVAGGVLGAIFGYLYGWCDGHEVGFKAGASEAWRQMRKEPRGIAMTEEWAARRVS